RLSYGGAQEYFGIRPDLTCLGKIVGGGFPLAAFGGRKKIMELLSPLGEVYQAGTLSGNPVAVSAGISVLRILKKTSPYEKMRARTSILAGIISDTGRRCGVQLKISAAASLFSIFFTAEEVTDFGKAQTQNLKLFGKFYRNMIEENIYLSPSGFESNFLSLAHTGKDIEKTAEAVEKSLKKMRG
ncbi:MAG TPA: aminotransferase class III-fold pyridoxal phosphate-dependent enzyme, partial [bacterium]|nr:aminotransferase class III-fold pyridoxal phosphate-dependent enzyme [bacterium]